jgi:hypothetical protein
MQLYLDILGYIGTALVIFSMSMTSVTKLRFFNICGSVLSTIYAVAGRAWPIVIMNVCLMSINTFYLVRGLIKRDAPVCVGLSANDPTVRYLLAQNLGEESLSDAPEGGEATVVYVGSAAIAVAVGRREGGKMEMTSLWLDPAQGSQAMEHAMIPFWRENGISEWTLPTARTN